MFFRYLISLSVLVGTSVSQTTDHPTSPGAFCTESDFSLWSQWSTCSVTCGQGLRSRSRDCNGAISTGSETCVMTSCDNRTEPRQEFECSTGIDLSFLIDTSGSVGLDNFGKVKEFTKDVTTELKTGYQRLNLTVITFNSEAKISLSLNDSSKLSELLTAEDKLNYTHGGTETHKALQLLYQSVIRNDTDSPQVAIVITDGSSWHPDLTKHWAEQLKTLGVVIYVVGVGDDFNPFELSAISSDPDKKYLFRLNNYDELSSLIGVFSHKKCPVTSTAQSSTTTTTIPPTTESQSTTTITTIPTTAETRTSTYTSASTETQSSTTTITVPPTAGTRTDVSSSTYTTASTETQSTTTTTTVPPTAETRTNGSSSTHTTTSTETQSTTTTITVPPTAGTRTNGSSSTYTTASTEKSTSSLPTTTITPLPIKTQSASPAGTKAPLPVSEKTPTGRPAIVSTKTPTPRPSLASLETSKTMAPPTQLTLTNATKALAASLAFTTAFKASAHSPPHQTSSNLISTISRQTTSTSFQTAVTASETKQTTKQKQSASTTNETTPISAATTKVQESSTTMIREPATTTSVKIPETTTTLKTSEMSVQTRSPITTLTKEATIITTTQKESSPVVTNSSTQKLSSPIVTREMTTSTGRTDESTTTTDKQATTTTPRPQTVSLANQTEPMIMSIEQETTTKLTEHKESTPMQYERTTTTTEIPELTTQLPDSTRISKESIATQPATTTAKVPSTNETKLSYIASTTQLPEATTTARQHETTETPTKILATETTTETISMEATTMSYSPITIKQTQTSTIPPATYRYNETSTGSSKKPTSHLHLTTTSEPQQETTMISKETTTNIPTAPSTWTHYRSPVVLTTELSTAASPSTLRSSIAKVTHPDTTVTQPPTTVTETPGETSSTEPPTTTTPTCIAKFADVVFVVDSSGSIGRPNFEKIKKFIKDVVLTFDVDPRYTRVGLIEFSTVPKIEFKLHEMTNISDLLDAIDNVTYSGGGTATSDALELMRLEGFDRERPLAPDIAIVITDGLSKFPQLTKVQAQMARAEGIAMFSIGIGNETSSTELHAIASSPRFVFEVGDYQTLFTLDSIVAHRACGVVLPEEYHTRSSTPSTTTRKGCFDIDAQCPSYPRDSCTDYEPWARKNCPRKCGFCSGFPLVEPPCEDTISDCLQYGTDMCSSTSQYEWVDSHCRKFCGFCGNKTDSVVTTTTTPVTTVSTVATCTDLLPNCSNYGGPSMCQAYGDWAKVRCAKYCEFCYNYTTVPSITVNNIKCPNWKLPDLCTIEDSDGNCCPMPKCPDNIILTVKRH